MKKIVMTMALVLSASSAFADQCAYINKDQAAKAVKTLLNADSVKTLCEPCGETKAVALKEIQSIEIKATGFENTVEIKLDGKSIDLAYTFVNGKNLANTAGCEATGVSEKLSK